MLEESELRVARLQEAFAAYGEPSATPEGTPAQVPTEEAEDSSSE
jgi:hypothetical protein